jgi:hypothetical protein
MVSSAMGKRLMIVEAKGYVNQDGKPLPESPSPPVVGTSLGKGGASARFGLVPRDFTPA